MLYRNRPPQQLESEPMLVSVIHGGRRETDPMLVQGETSRRRTGHSTSDEPDWVNPTTGSVFRRFVSRSRTIP